MTQPPPRPNLTAIAARVRNPGGTVGYWALKDIAVLLAYARSLETALQRIAAPDPSRAQTHPPGCTTEGPLNWQARIARDALHPPGRDGT